MKAQETLKASEEYRIFLSDISEYVDDCGYESVRAAQEAGFLFDEFLREIRVR
jgi:hypothetical protein